MCNKNASKNKCVCGRTRYANGYESTAICLVARGGNRHGVEAELGGNDGSSELIFQKKYLFDKFS